MSTRVRKTRSARSRGDEDRINFLGRDNLLPIGSLGSSTMPFLSNIVVYTGGYLFMVFIAVCLATGLYYLAEMVEEYTRVTKKVLGWSIKISIGLNVALLVVDRLPFLNIFLSIAALCTYHTLLKKFPFMALTSPEFLGSVAALVANHFMWMRHFRNETIEFHSVEYLLGFFLMVVWIVPFGFFISLAANEQVLPGGGLAGANGSSSSLDSGVMPGGGGYGMGGGLDYGGGGKRKRSNIVLKTLDFGKAQWERFAKKKVFPNGMPAASYKERNL